MVVIGWYYISIIFYCNKTMTTLKQTQEEELETAEPYLGRQAISKLLIKHSMPTRQVFISEITALIREFLLSAMEASARGAIEATRLEYEKTRHTWKKDCDCIQCYFINGFDQAVSDQATKAKDYMEGL